jgi:hypothetical protein
VVVPLARHHFITSLSIEGIAPRADRAARDRAATRVDPASIGLACVARADFARADVARADVAAGAPVARDVAPRPRRVISPRTPSLQAPSANRGVSAWVTADSTDVMLRGRF